MQDGSAIRSCGFDIDDPLFSGADQPKGFDFLLLHSLCIGIEQDIAGALSHALLECWGVFVQTKPVGGVGLP